MFHQYSLREEDDYSSHRLSGRSGTNQNGGKYFSLEMPDLAHKPERWKKEAFQINAFQIFTHAFQNNIALLHLFTTAGERFSASI